uniref:AA_permease domain-containing protein n=1 Tax=Caenorhabditis tropicalis TaxID=1561998 RepID=A0A1I7UCM8_9PELO
MVAVMLPTARKPIELKQPSAIDQNWPCFVIAFSMASLKLVLAYTGIEDFKIAGFNDVNVFFLMELGSTPLAIINPRVWFAMFMCSLAYMSIETGYPTIAVATIASMLILTYVMEYLDYKREEQSENTPVYQILPLVDEKFKKQEMI